MTTLSGQPGARPRPGGRGALSRRGLTLVELVMALSITAMVALAIAGMMGAVSTGVGTRRDNRTVMVHANSAQMRLAAYVAPSRCVLDVDDHWLVLWLNDSRESDTVHATEIRWLWYEEDDGAIKVAYVSFPDHWPEIIKQLSDAEYSMHANWSHVLSAYQPTRLEVMTLVDGLTTAEFDAEDDDPLDVRHVVFRLGLETHEGSADVQVAGTIRRHFTPDS